ncbi:GTPase ObgE [Ructibacterium gallinarum]|uniref:GTPase Obg n=1 Tax=Ructibacterium gallinarum TaxID=2779355 RepID=A0A9D5R9A2_9FIRM|nr:GTPase ObgE [Ructibacterium gallinarum]MBE5040284.1 GTPase ObgE [Ructibacterium gallinarum]
MFSDFAKIYIKAGDGGRGAVTFHREKYIAAGGPDGGDGGRGGNVVFVADSNVNTLMDFRYKRKYIAESGENGRDAKRNGKNGRDLEINVPVGTLIREEKTNLVLCDLKVDKQRFVAAKGGTGGWGNTHFATATRQTPKFAKSGTPGEEYDVTLELKMIADVGLLGFPNVGKSTFLSIISDARPKIANYHFTTLSPNLGMVDLGDGHGFVVADIPGIIEGAHEGVGLGHAFLRHVERTRLLLHIVDVSGSEGRDPVEDFLTIHRELRLYSEKLAEKPQIILANKADIPGFEENYYIFKEKMEDMGYPVFPISAATKRGIPQVLQYTWKRLAEIPKDMGDENYEMYDPALYAQKEGITVKQEGEMFVVEGLPVQKLVGSTNFDDYESLQYFQRSLIRMGVIRMLQEAGVQEGDTVRMYGIEFDFIL